MKRNCRLQTVLVLLTLLSGCSSAKHQRVPQLETTPVTGIVHVDGKPEAGVTVECHPNESSAIKHPVSAITDLDGKFSLGMYEKGDGLPEGTYSLSFVWEFGMVPGDKFRKAYADPSKSQHKVTVVKGNQNDLGVIELSTKGPQNK